jgi:hypothetical protein
MEGVRLKHIKYFEQTLATCLETLATCLWNTLQYMQRPNLLSRHPYETLATYL